ncbi:YhbY family RNA-binding protein [methane-oxidizing endosymbiont of Gigantopelta aegis]|uniref:YhbY family RNA-binding protein n=1 Tax=methane-oxidizing endosymbiont of Gigantopelta aegis TaxID=2794938 RepID=UPI0018DE4E91|nr:YhbY family RNA-binding protein [methane-oxidizing endosymbiont of Gigantopelta aegis]
MNAAEKKKLKSQAHALKPVVTIGQLGLTDAVIKETNIALNAHELIKIKIRTDKDQRLEIQHQLCLKTEAEPVQMIGQIAVIYRKNPDK